MHGLKALLTAIAIAAATACGGCDFKWSFSTNTAGITPNELTEAVGPIVEQWKSLDPQAGIASAMGNAAATEVRWTTEKRWKQNSHSLARLDGWARLQDGRQIDISASLTNSGAGWRVSGLNSGSASLLPEAWLKHEAMIRETMGQILDCIRDKSFASLLPRTAAPFQKKFTAEALNERMKDLFKLTVTGDPIANRTPAFRVLSQSDQPLRLAGHYSLGKTMLQFDLSYLQEGGALKPVGWNVNFKAIAEQSPPQS